jgi:arabinofuranan 3-O-arabinosyltransferase
MTTEASLRPVRGGPRLTPSGAAAAGLYAFFILVSLLQQPGRTTYDTRAELTQRPLDFLRDGFTLWHPESNLGEFQNQAYGYLFPQGSWFVLGDLLGSPDWVTQRLWSALVLIVAVEGARRVALALDLAGPVALLVGLAYGFSPRLLGTVPVITGEALPGAMMPWILLPVLLAFSGRLGYWRAALLSGAAIVCMGGVNAVENVGSLPLVVITVLWGWRRGLVGWRFVVAWFGAALAASLWWVLPLLVLARYAPPFYQYVESASNTTAALGWSEAVRGDTHWVAYLITGDRAWWPAAHALVTDPFLIVVSAVVAAAGLVGLCLWQHPVRSPLVLSMVIGLGALTVAHGGWAGTPISGSVRDLLDGPLAIFRNVHKIDPVVRLPLAIGFGYSAKLAATWLAARRPELTQLQTAALLVPGVLVLSLGQPFLLNDARTPGWSTISEPWQQARSYLTEHDDGRSTLVLPGSGFAQQDWGWTLDEPLLLLGGADFVARTQVPLIPGESIRFLNALDQLTVTGRATPELGAQLARAGIGHVVIRRDLVRRLTGSPHPGGAAVSAAKGGLTPVAAFGEDGEGGAEVEVLAVNEAQPRLRSTPVDSVLTVRGAPESVLALQDAGLVEPGQASVLEGEPGWKAPADVVTDDDQKRERAFGATDESLSAPLGPTEDWRTERSAHDFPTVPGAGQVVARYDGLDSLTASSAQGYADNFGPVVPQFGPYSAVDGDPNTRWASSRGTDPRDQWLRVDFTGSREVHEVTVLPTVDDGSLVPIRRLTVRAGAQSRTVVTSPSGAPSTVRFDGRAVPWVEVRVDQAATSARTGAVSLREVTIDDLVPTRTLSVPGDVAPDAVWLLGSGAERRACNDTLGVPDCDIVRIRPAEEAEGLDRTLTTTQAASVRLQGWVMPRATPEATRLLEPFDDQRVGVTSVYGFDPKVAGRFAYDGELSTAWVSDPRDRNPTVLLQWDQPQVIDSVFVASDDEAGVPTTAIVRAGKRQDVVALTGGVNTLSPPIHRRSVTIEFVRPADADRVVVPELFLGGTDLARPFFANVTSGAVCGLGPNVTIDGRTVSTRVVGTLADIVNGTPMRLESCGGDGGAVEVDAGVHRVTAPPSAEFAVLELGAVSTDSPAPAGSARSVDVQSWADSSRTADIGAGASSVISFPENYNSGWVAELDGRRLTPLHVDGWQQGWLVPAGVAGKLEMRFAPQRTYLVTLVIGIAISGSLLLLGLLCLLGSVRPRAVRGPARDWPPATRATHWATAVAALCLAALLLGPVPAAGAAAGILLARGSRRATGHTVAQPLLAAALGAGVLVVLSAVVDVVGLLAPVREAGDVFAALGFGLAVGLTLGMSLRGPSSRRGRHA